ncbi:MAG TPA: biopolymer transporter ExbD [Terriglobales bacterium]|nr:biopolymer transporter ExbD [Terriglobales bacterium]
MAFSTAGPGAPQMNVTPLIDVLLVLLVIFMLVVIQEKKYGLEAQIPQEEKKSDHVIPGPERTIVIQVRDGKSAGRPEVKINEEPVTWERLHDRLLEIYSLRVEKVAFVKADDDIDFQPVADVIDTAHNVGIDRVGLLHDETATLHQGLK